MKRSWGVAPWCLGLFCANLGAQSGEKAAEKTPMLPGKEASKTVITGERMNLLQKGAAVEFVGGVTLVRGNDLLKADRMVSDEKKGLTQAWGRVYLRREDPVAGALWEAWSDEGQYNAHLSSGTMWGRKAPARVVRRPLKDAASQRFEMSAGRITFFRAAGPGPGLSDGAVGASRGPGLSDGAQAVAATSTVHSVDAEERVYVRFEEAPPEFAFVEAGTAAAGSVRPLSRGSGPDPASGPVGTTASADRITEIWAGSCFHDGITSSTTFRGGYGESVPDRMLEEGPALPYARQREGADIRELTGEVVTYLLNDRRLVAEGNVRALLSHAEERTDASAR